MSGIITAQERINGPACDHRDMTVTLDGETFEFHLTEAEVDAEPWDEAAKRQFIRMGIKRLRTLGVTLDQILGRVCNGEEATNVKQYLLLAKDVTKTNIGTSYVNIPPGANGERTLVEFTGCTEFRIVVNAVMPGTGPYNARVVRDSDDAVLYESPNIPAQNGTERELDTGWLTIPLQAAALEVLRFQAKSGAATDDPIFRRCVMLVR